MQRHVIQLIGVLIIGGILGAVLCFVFPRHINVPKQAVITPKVDITPTKTLGTPTVEVTSSPIPTIATHSAQLMLNAPNKTAGSSATPTHAATR